MPRLGLGIRLRCSALPESIISGTAFPGETLTSTQPGQWQADGVDISGETGSSYLVRLSDIGKVIRQSRSANTLTIWKPGDIAGVARFWSSLSNVLNSISPDVAATNGQTVRRWNGIISGTPIEQATGTLQPIYRSTGQSGNPSLEFDGVDDQFVSNTNTVGRSRSQIYMIVGARDTNPTGGAGTHDLARIYYTPPGGQTILSIRTRDTSNVFACQGRRSATDAIRSAQSSPNNSNYNVLAVHGDFTSGSFRLRINGSQVATNTFSGGAGSTDATDTQISIGQGFPGHITCVCLVNDTLTTTQLSQLERYIGLFGNLNIPLV